MKSFFFFDEQLLKFVPMGPIENNNWMIHAQYQVHTYLINIKINDEAN